eukprot:COSAG05_NODE_22269_length_266_cov_0.586826_1_plen_28_part_01
MVPAPKVLPPPVPYWYWYYGTTGTSIVA